MTELENELQKRFGFLSFRPGQKEVIEHFLSGQDVLGVLPTGTGKSMLFQFPTSYFSGTVIILSPLVSLMTDQVQQLKLRGEKKVVAFTSFQSRAEREYALRNIDNYHYIFVSPESLQNRELQNALLTVHVAYFVYDEAHCLVQWGMDFRPDYLRAAEWVSTNFTKQILALTATATEQTRLLIKETLHRPRMVEIVRSVDRPSIALQTIQVESDLERFDEMIRLIRQYGGPGILYTQSRKRAEKYATQLIKLGIPTAAYHGGMDTLDRSLIQQQFSSGELEWICATNAFGMGIHKANIRQVLHDHIPTSLSNYLQEFGRASRDGKQSLATLFYTADDYRKSLFLATADLPDQQDIEYFAQSVELDEQKTKVLSYWNSRLSLSEQNQLFERLRISKKQNILELYKIITGQTCLREGIGNAFGETNLPKPVFCCNKCQSLEAIQMTHESAKERERMDLSSAYKKRLKQLFP